MLKYIKLLRVHHWVKNLFILAAAFFGGVFSIDLLVSHLLPGFLCFSLLSSGVYVLNDLMDAPADRLHPEKSKRPIASGAVKTPHAIGLILGLVTIALVGGWFIQPSLSLILGIYLVVNIGYTMGLKSVAILDILMVSSGFILRVLAGGVLAGVVVSHWLYIMTFLLAVFLAIAKRRDDLLLLESTGNEMRRSIKGYSLEFVNTAMGMMAGVIIVSYLLYITSPELEARFPGKPLFISTVFVFAGLLRYLQLAIVLKKSGSPTSVLLKDFFTQLCVIGWVVFFAVFIYMQH